MNDVRKQYKNTLNIIGLTMIIWVVLSNLLATVYYFVDTLAWKYAIPVAAEIISSVTYDIVYLSMFMVPAAVFKVLNRGKKLEPMRLGIRFDSIGETLAMIVGGITCAFAFAYFNSMIVGDVAQSETFFNEPIVYTSDLTLILQFITIGIVPAFCEEFLFRGIILSNLMPYGKSTAIMVSSVLFGLMHGNFYQFLYTTVAGIILGYLYVKTESIWASTLMHMANNSISILQTAVFDRLSEEYSGLVWMIFECALFMAGIICIVYLLSKRMKKMDANEEKANPVFGAPLGERMSKGGSRAISASDAVRCFFVPTIIAFLVYSIINGSAVLSMM